ncbi:MAG: 4Fe-4S binding protein [Bacteroidetes bacterium]|nr:4Fe-4S binding protein [Bacteroidota bacterium]
MKIAIVSGKGGTGKSTVTAGFISLSNNILALDCDVDASNLYLVFDTDNEQQENYISGQSAHIDKDKCVECGICADACNFEAVKQGENGYYIDDVSCEGCELCSRLCPQQAISMVDSIDSKIYLSKFKYGHLLYGRLAPGEDNSGKFINVLRQKADKIAETEGYKNQILDGPPGIGCPVLSTITGIDKIIIVTEPSLSGFSDLRRIHEVANSFSTNISVIINKYDLDLQNSHDIEKWCNGQGAKVIGKLPFDKRMVESIMQRQSIIEYAPKCECSEVLRQAYSQCF